MLKIGFYNLPVVDKMNKGERSGRGVFHVLSKDFLIYHFALEKFKLQLYYLRI